MAAIAIESYQPLAYQGLTSLKSAFDTFVVKSPLSIIEEKILATFVKHEVYNDLAVSLLQRHFDMDENERLVEIGTVSSPWLYKETDEGYLGGSIKPRSWLFKDGKMIPYEFGYNEAGKNALYKDLPDKPAFYAGFNAILEKQRLTGLLGLTLITERKQPGLTKYEKTFGRSNVVFTIGENDVKILEKEAVPAQFEFSPSTSGIVVPVNKFICGFGCYCGVS